MTNRFPNPRPQFLFSNGRPIPDGTLTFYETGTTTLKDTFADIGLSIPNENPLPLTADGRVPNCFYAGTARVVLTSAQQGQIWDIDGVGIFSSGTSFDDWNSVVEYEKGAYVVASDGEIYRSLQNVNIGNDPTVSTAFWERVEFIREWNTNVSYSINEIVKASDGFIYRSLTNNNQGNDPKGGLDPINWGSPLFDGANQNYVVSVKDFGAVGDGVADDTAAIQAAVAAWQGTPLNDQFAALGERALYFPSGTYNTTGMTITTSGTGQVIRGDGQLISRLIGVEIVIDDRHCSILDLSLTNPGTYGIRLAETSRRTCIIRNVHVRDRIYGIYLEAGADDTMTDCVFEKNNYNLYSPNQTAAVSSGDFEITGCKFVTASVNNIYAPTGELKFSNCVQGNAASVGMIMRPRDDGNSASVECYYNQMTNTVQQRPTFDDITAVADAGGGDITITADNNFVAGDDIEIFGTTDYNGSFEVVSATDTTFNVTAAFVSSQTGVVRRQHERIWRITAIADAGGGNITVTTDGDHDLVPNLANLVIAGTSDYDGTYDVVDVTGSNTFTVAAAFVSSQTGTASMVNWDVVIDGEATTGRVNDMYFIGGNINFIKIKDGYNINFNGARLKEQIWLEGENDRIMFIRSRRGRRAGQTEVDIPIGGSSSNTGWTEVATNDTDGQSTDDDTALVMATPNFAAGVGVDNIPSLNELKVAPDAIRQFINGTEIFEVNEGGVKQLALDLGANLTISAGAITPTNSFHRVLGEGSAADNLTSIAAGSFAGQILILENLSNGAPITVIDDSAARLQGDFVLNDARAVLGLYWDGGEWAELFRRSNGAAQQEKLPKTTVSGLSSLINVEEGDAIYVTDLRVFNGTGTQETAGNGTGGLATYNGSNWVVAGTNAVAVA